MLFSIRIMEPVKKLRTSPLCVFSEVIGHRQMIPGCAELFMFDRCAHLKCQRQLFAQFSDSIGTYSHANAMSRDIDLQPLDARLKSRDHVSITCAHVDCTHRAIAVPRFKRLPNLRRSDRSTFDSSN
jgi:hypothetical protein